MASEDKAAFFVSCGIDQKRAAETLKNASLTATLNDVLKEVFLLVSTNNSNANRHKPLETAILSQ